MLTGLPNFAVCIGYTNASWTLRADLTHRLVCRVLNYLDRHDYAAAVPLPRERARGAPAARPELGLRPALDRRSSRARATAARGGSGRTTCSTR